MGGRWRRPSNRAGLLWTWADISDFLGISRSTAERLEKLGMPVRRPTGHMVMANRTEVLEWLKAGR